MSVTVYLITKNHCLMMALLENDISAILNKGYFDSLVPRSTVAPLRLATKGRTKQFENDT